MGFPSASWPTAGLLWSEGRTKTGSCGRFTPTATPLIGSSPLVLLGLLAIVDHLGPDWYRAPRVELPKGSIVDIEPEAMATIPEEQIPAGREALRRLASIRGRTVECGETREELIAAARAWVEETRRIEELNLSKEELE
jgi:hypothetical protein